MPHAVTATFGTLPVETKAAPPVSGTAYPETWFVDLLGGTPTASKVRVNAQTAMRCPPVKRAVDLISSTIGVLPVRVFRVGQDGARTPDATHPAQPIVQRRANPWTAAGKFRELLTRDALLHGDGFAAVVRVGGKPRELIHLPPGTVSVELDEITREPRYIVTLDGGSQMLSWRDVLHVMAPSLDGVTGANPVHLGREAIGLALTLEAHAARLFGNGARPGGIISVPDNLGDAAALRIKTSWHSAFGGDRTGETAVLEKGATFNPITLDAVSSEFNASRRHQVREIANVFGLPSTLLNDLENGTYSNVEGLAQSFRDETILPVVASWEAALERALLADEEFASHAIAFDLESLDRADLASKTDAMAKRRAAGTTTANEERRTLNLPPHAQGEELGSPFTTANAGTPQEAPAHV